MEIELSEIVEKQEDINQKQITTVGDDASSSINWEIPTAADKTKLYRAALKNNWKAAEILIQGNQNLVTTPITDGRETAMHIAAIEGHQHFVTKLLEHMDREDLKIQNTKGCTSLCYAAAAGHTRIAKILVGDPPESTLPTVKGSDGSLPLYMAAMQGFEEIANFLYPISEFGSWTEQEKIDLLTTAISSKLYGLAKRIVDEHTLTMGKDSNGEAPLLVLARDPSAFRCTRQGIWVKIMRNVLTPCTKAKTPDKNARDDAHQLLDCLWNPNEAIPTRDIEVAQWVDTTELFFVAAECGNDDFLVELLRRDHNLLYKIDKSRHSIFHIAVMHRYVQVFNLIYEFVGIKDLISIYIDNERNNILHLAGTLTPQAKNQLNCIPGAALQMQREVLWFKEVEKLVPPSYKNKKNKKGQTPHELFLVKHKSLMKEGEKFMKQTAKACMLVTMLIATVVFTTVFTVPGGYNNTTEHPILKNKRLLKVFSVSEAVATLSSLISMLMFLSILTSRYSDDDFLRTLPSFLVVGVASLFVSIVAMMVAFCSCLLFLEHGWTEVILLLVFFASVPTMFVVLKYPLLVAIIRCTCSSTWLFRSYGRLHS